MKKIALLLFFKILVIACIGQVPADSLKGTYVGDYYYADPATNPWTIIRDTEYVTDIDTVNCYFYAHGCMDFSLGGTNVYTDYFSCNTASPANYYTKFYNSDSLRVIADDVPRPFPNPSYSKRFYGKRISGSITGTNKLKSHEVVDVKIYPNPGNGLFTLQTNKNTDITITNSLGETVFDTSTRKNKTQINLTQQAKGVYYIKLQGDDFFEARKIVIQ